MIPAGPGHRSGSPGLTPSRLLTLVALLALVTYANAAGNGWALDDEGIVAANPVVTEGRWDEAVAGAWWRLPGAAPSLWRPTTLTALAAQWRAFGDRPAAFHAVGVVLHAGVAVLVAALLAAVLPWPAAAAGGALFAVHPVHVEAVANVVGQAELLAAAGYLAACLVFLRRRSAGPTGRALGAGVIALLYAVALGAKESAVTLPGVLLLLVLLAPAPGDERGRWGRALREAPLLVLLTAVLGAYLVLRVWVLGAVGGDAPAPELVGLGTGERVLTSLSLWPTWLRLLVWPAALSSDYGAGVLAPALSVRLDVVVGAVVLIGLVAAALHPRVPPWAALAAGWLALTTLPVSHLLLPAGTLLAERTLYLPSVALPLAAGGALATVLRRRPARARLVWGAAALVMAALLVRTAVRTPTWRDSFTVMTTLARAHPEAARAYRGRAAGLVQAGDVPAALEQYERALVLLPSEYGLLTEAGALYRRQGNLARARDLLTAAVAADPARPLAYRQLGEVYLLAGDGRAAHGTALAGLARWGSDHDLWAVVSESYVAKGDLPAAIRARVAAMAVGSSQNDQARLAELLDAQARIPTSGTAP